jgi:hypothetical protein
MRLGLNPQTRRSCIANATLRDATRTLIQNLITNYELRITNYLRPIHLNRTVLRFTPITDTVFTYFIFSVFCQGIDITLIRLIIEHS